LLTVQDALSVAGFTIHQPRPDFAPAKMMGRWAVS